MKTITIEWIEYTLTPVEKKYKRWRAEKWGDYYSIVSNWEIYLSQHDNFEINDLRYNIGNYYQTEEEAIKERDKRLAIVKVNDKIMELNEWWIENWDNRRQEKWYIMYNNDKKLFESGYNTYTNEWTLLSRIKSEEIAEQIIKEFPDELKLIFWIK